ncbi:hypothetical protein GOBAR_DD00712 [Gossypium barbadense]|nr:hypothetical protein GOBAR_DD00712 [Gossypium barbadense]
MASYKFVWEHFLSKIKVIPKPKLTGMQKLAKEELKVDISKGTCSWARKWALEEINGKSTLPLAGVAPPAPFPPAPFDPTPPTHSQTVASEASASSPPAPSTQPTPPSMPISSTQQILTRLCSRENKLCKGLGYTQMRGQGCKF